MTWLNFAYGSEWDTWKTLNREAIWQANPFEGKKLSYSSILSYERFPTSHDDLIIDFQIKNCKAT